MDISTDWVIFAAIILLVAMVVLLFISTDSDRAAHPGSSMGDAKPRSKDASLHPTTTRK